MVGLLKELEVVGVLSSSDSSSHDLCLDWQGVFEKPDKLGYGNLNFINLATLL